MTKFIIIFLYLLYTFSLSSAQCQTISNINTGYSQLMISNSQFFVLGTSSASPYNLRMYKITFSFTSVDWANQMACTTMSWSASYSESVLSTDKFTIYSFFTFGSSASLYFWACLHLMEALQLQGTSQMYLYRVYLGHLWTETT